MTISMPASPGFRRSRFGIETNSQTFQSPLAKTTQTALLSGSRWVATYTLPRMNRQQAAVWQAFFLQLEGQANTFYGFDPDARTPRGFITGSVPLVMGGSQTGSSLTIDGLAASTNNILLPGDYAVVNGELKMTTAPLNSNGSGEGTWSFKPALRESPADNAPLTITNATCIMMLVDDTQAMWETNENGIYEEMTFTGVEQLV